MLGHIKKSTAFALLLTMTAVVAACGASKPQSNDAGPATEASASASNSASASANANAGTETTELTVSAAASLTDALGEIEKAFEAEHSDIRLTFNFGSSGALQQQIEQGAPADLFLAAAAKNMKALVDKGLVEEDKQTNLLNNSLVVVVPADGGAAVSQLSDLEKPEVKNVAVGIPESVPAGKYAQEALTNAKLWDALKSKTVQGKDVRQVLQYVETGNADAGFVYKTDALTADKAKVAFEVDPATYSAIEYPVGIVKATKHGKEADEFYRYLQSQEALDVFIKYGFTVPK
ncbi:molybdate ABC transporter substrate-binding protein [Cohnella xylanilytica]|uniref:molybdate ABC transporter substrate-binding protein n=1 Tax=Cohnella xylanilytica TaxID=557555 RepID=UPI001B0FC58A|nr:molybdate ABC transporter substrate-binding protein [Cohnella xylanilytica]GIO12675.1 molybdate ABC transporter substrate-binding protein [Cohnella xylanilytica]